MAGLLKLNEPLFFLDDFRNLVDKDDCFVCLLSGTSKNALLSASRFLTFYNTRWFVDRPSQERRLALTDEEQDEAEGIAEQAIGDLNMTCNLADIITEIQAINISLGDIETAITGITLDTDVSGIVTAIGDLETEVSTMATGLGTNLNDIEEQLNEIIGQMGGTEVILT